MWSHLALCLESAKLQKAQVLRLGHLLPDVPGKLPSESKEWGYSGIRHLLISGVLLSTSQEPHSGIPSLVPGVGAMFIASGSDSSSLWRQRKFNPVPAPGPSSSLAGDPTAPPRECDSLPVHLL